MHLVEGRAASGPAVDSARQNLASTFVNAFVNAGFGTDKLMTGAHACGAHLIRMWLLCVGGPTRAGWCRLVFVSPDGLHVLL